MLGVCEVRRRKLCNNYYNRLRFIFQNIMQQQIQIVFFIVLRLFQGKSIDLKRFILLCFVFFIERLFKMDYMVVQFK
jgi:hypothetical protein